MRLGITTFCTDRSLRPDRLAREVEGRGFESLWFPEHSNIPARRTTRWPGATDGNEDLPDFYWRTLDVFVALSMAAAVTERIRLGIGVSLVVQRDPIWTAKEIASLDWLSGGRFELAVGFGWNEEEAANHGVTSEMWKRRRTLVREKVEAMKALWREDTAAYAGTMVQVDPTWQLPKPIQRPHPPIIIGGGDGPVLFDHIATWADGWAPISAKRTLAAPVARLREAFAAHGRDPDELRVSIFGARPDLDVLAALAEEGIHRAILTIWPEAEDEAMRLLDEWAPWVERVA